MFAPPTVLTHRCLTVLLHFSVTQMSDNNTLANFFYFCSCTALKCYIDLYNMSELFVLVCNMFVFLTVRVWKKCSFNIDTKIWVLYRQPYSSLRLRKTNQLWQLSTFVRHIVIKIYLIGPHHFCKASFMYFFNFLSGIHPNVWTLWVILCP